MDKELERALRLIDLEPAMVRAVKNAKSLLYDRLQKGHRVEGWKLVMKRKHREWVVCKDKIAKILMEAGFEREDIFNETLKSPGMIEALAMECGPVKEKMVKALFKRDEDRLVLARGDDSRPAVEYNRLEEFQSN